MVKKLRLMLEYGCYPVWLYNEEGFVVDTLLPKELRNDHELDAKFTDLQERYEALFINNEHVFDYVGFRTEADKAAFLADWEKAVKELTEKAKGKYEIVNDIGKSF
jgi:hypothetical protein